MRYTLMLPTDRVHEPDQFGTAEALRAMAATAESAGFEACCVTDHPFPTATFINAGGHHALDPFVALSFAAAATEVLRLQTNIYVAAYRNPFLTAKSVASLDALSGGRVILGVAAGYLRGEFEALGVDFSHRGALLDEALSAMTQAWSGQPMTAAGGSWQAEANVMLPVPAASPPIWIGGNSAAAVRRVVRHGTGWLPFPASEKLAAAVGTDAIPTAAVLGRRIAALHTLADREIDVCMTPFGQRFNATSLDIEGLLAEAAELEAIGVTWLTVVVPARDRDHWLAQVSAFGAARGSGT